MGLSWKKPRFKIQELYLSHTDDDGCTVKWPKWQCLRETAQTAKTTFSKERKSGKNNLDYTIYTINSLVSLSYEPECSNDWEVPVLRNWYLRHMSKLILRATEYELQGWVSHGLSCGLLEFVNNLAAAFRASWPPQWWKTQGHVTRPF